VHLADEAAPIGPALSRKSYLNAEAILKAARDTGADALHPGYGFLSENADFARACQDAGLTFIGPQPAAIRLAGHKSEARRILSAAGVPVIPGSEGILANAGDAAALAERIGYPVIIKAAGGGGGRGMRIAHAPAELADLFRLAAGEAAVAFGASDLYLEKYIAQPRHVEIQVLADDHGHMIHLGERECSIQKRYQKLIEEAPSPLLDEDLRARMGAAALQAARQVGYRNAGTVEFLVDAEKRFYFMEINARVQVEHPVTEMVTGLDIVQAQIRIAAGEALTLRQEDVRLKGWAIECRINAADPANDFMPSPGEVGALKLPEGPGIRVDTYLAPGCLVPPFYDALIAKLIAWGPDRASALFRMRRALEDFAVEGIHTTVPFHRQILADRDFQAGRYDTHFLERFIPATD
jgi:acetyl-CoA carboxylase biotin carboxylase subunit